MLTQRRAHVCGLDCSQSNQQNLVTRGKKEKVVSQSENYSLGKRDDSCAKFKLLGRVAKGMDCLDSHHGCVTYE